MKQKAANVPWYLVPVALWLAGALIQERLATPESEPPIEPFRNQETDTFLVSELERSLGEFDSKAIDERPWMLPADALATSLSSRTRIREREIKGRPKDSPDLKNDKGFLFIDSNKQTFAASKLGLDHKHHFQNSFLVGYHPFDVSEIWMPHEVLRMRLKYQLDKDNFAGFQEVWLSSYEAFQRGRGDCEDHAIALADWLIEMGEDARVATGTHDGSGHAWVVLVREKGTFLLEATSKKRRRLFSSYPLASLATGYAPRSMFNREFFWINNEPEKPTDYTGSHWFKNGRVTR